MKIDDVVSDIDKHILFQEQEIANLEARKNRLLLIKEAHPTAHYENGCVCLDDVWDKITCMRIEQKRKYYSSSKVNVKFLLGKRNSIDGLKIYTHPFENTVAEIRHNYGATRKKEILIFDYKNLIPPECPKRAAFIKRIKLYLVDRIMSGGLIIDDNSVGVDEIKKLMMLR